VESGAAGCLPAAQRHHQRARTTSPGTRGALDARVSSAHQHDDLTHTRHLPCVPECAAARGYPVVARDGARPTLQHMLPDARGGVRGGNERGRLSRMGFSSITTRLEHQGRQGGAGFQEGGADWVAALVATRTSRWPRLARGGGRPPVVRHPSRRGGRGVLSKRRPQRQYAPHPTCLQGRA
jgi:hypothetical protein